MPKFYFTYGLDERHPFQGGWTVVEAPDDHKARQAFRAIHPDKIPGVLNCAMVYGEEGFAKTRTFETGTNYGLGCQEIIKLEVTPCVQRKE